MSGFVEATTSRVESGLTFDEKSGDAAVESTAAAAAGMPEDKEQTNCLESPC